MQIHASNGRKIGEVDIASWTKAQTGFGYLRIQRTAMMSILLENASKEEITVTYGKQITGIEESDDNVKARFADGTTDTGDFLLGCDGIHSVVRSLYVDPDVVPEYSGIANVYSLVPVSALAEEPREPLTALHTTLTSNGLFAITPATRGRDLIYWFFSREVVAPSTPESRDGWKSLADKEDDNKQLLLELLDGAKESPWVAMQRDIIEKTDYFKFYPIYRLPMGRPWSRGRRCLIIGDAAHAMPPHASQGVSMALEDVFLLSNLFRSERLLSEESLRQYVERRRRRTDAMLLTSQRNGSVRKQMSVWQLRILEITFTVGLWFYGFLRLARLGLGFRATVYDVEREVF